MQENAPKERPFNLAVKQTSESAEFIEKRINELTEKLKPVLSDSKPVEEKDRSVSPVNSQFDDFITTLNFKLSCFSDSLEDLISRIVL